MRRYSIQYRDRIFAKGYGFLSFDRNIDKNVGKNISKNLSRKYSQKSFIMLNNLLQMHLKLPQKKRFKEQQKQLAI